MTAIQPHAPLSAAAVPPSPRPFRLPRFNRPARSAIALAGLAAYVATFAVAGNGCWIDVALCIGTAAVVAWAGCAGLLVRSDRRPLAGRLWADAAASAATIGTMLLWAGAVLNLAVFAATGTGTLGAKVAALLFLPVHGGLLLLADVLSAAAFASAAGRIGGRPFAAGVGWAIGFNLLAILTLGLLRFAGAF